MKLLLDENLPHQLRHELPEHDCSTAAYMGWAGKENGDLLALASSAGFAAMLTKDAGVRYEQNLQNIPIAVVILRTRSNDIDDIRPLIPKLLAALETLSERQVTVIE